MARSTLLINVDIGETRVALIEDGILAELYVERQRGRSPVGNVYVGKVTRVLPGMQAAFVDIGLDRAAFLHVEDVINMQDPDKLAEDNEGSEEESESQKHRRVSRRTPIREVLKEGQRIVVQVSKGPIGTKGARVTSHVSLPGRYVVYAPTVDHVGVSKRIGRDRERRRLREVINSVKPPTGGVIVRTVAQGLTKKQLKADIGYLVKVWEETTKAIEAAKKIPTVVYEELDIVLRAARDLFTDEVDAIVVDKPEEYERVRRFLQLFLPERVKDIHLYEGSEPLFDEYGIEDEIARALSRKVPLPSGGYLIIDQAEALTAIDVNTGRFTGKGRDVTETIFQTNLEAVHEIAYQLRFRNIGGLIVLDFIDMDKQAHRDKVFRALLQVLRNDKAKTTAVRISELGLVEMTRKRTRESLFRTLYEPCFYCDGTGQLLAKTTVCFEVLRQMRREKDSLPGYQLVVNAHPAVCDVFEREGSETLEEAARIFQRRIVLKPRKEYHLEQFDLAGG
ncbi:MAG: Rne/Rng family ribonuclease [Polyangiales bacterium]